MTKNQSLAFRILFFLLGAGIVALAFALFSGERPLSPENKFLWASISLMYLVFSLPAFFSSITISGFSAKIPKITLVWLGVAGFLAASIAVIVLLKAKTIPLNAAIVGQAVLVFLFALDVYGAFFAASHAASVTGEEAAQRGLLDGIKAASQSLALSAKGLPPEYEASQKTILAAIEEIRYISPVSGGAGAEAEASLMASLQLVKELCGAAKETGGHVKLEGASDALLEAVKTRKLLRN